MIARRGEQSDRSARTLVLVAAAVLALIPTLGLVSPRSRSAAEPPSEKLLPAEHEPSPSPLVAPRPPHAETPARVQSAKESARRAEDAGCVLDSARPASDQSADLATLEVRVTRGGRAEPGA